MSADQRSDPGNPPQPAGSPDGAAPAGEPAAIRILIVEDNDADATLAQRLLRTAGLHFTATVVATRAAFATQLTTFAPDVILSDYSLPGFSGQDALAIARQQQPHIPVLIWSGVLGDDIAAGLIKQGATDYILKDRPARLPSAIQRALAEAAATAWLTQLEHQIAHAQRLASLGQYAAAQHAVQHTREMLTTARTQHTPPPR